MTTPAPEVSKLNALIEKFGGWAVVAVISLVVWSYQSGESETKYKFEQVNQRISANELSISRLNEGKASRSELKELQESFLRETQGLRQDFKDGFVILRTDIASQRGPALYQEKR